jgi:hypothetical protein
VSGNGEIERDVHIPHAARMHVLHVRTYAYGACLAGVNDIGQPRTMGSICCAVSLLDFSKPKKESGVERESCEPKSPLARACRATTNLTKHEQTDDFKFKTRTDHEDNIQANEAPPSWW